MYADRAIKPISFVGTLLLLAACSEQSPTDTRESDAPTRAVSRSAANLISLQQATEPFTVRAPLDPYRIHQLPVFMIHSKVGADLVIQRLVLPTGSVPWHTHPGPSFAIVERGRITTSTYSPKTGCSESAVLEPGDTFFRPGEEVHRLTVVSAENAVLYVVRMNIPVGGAITVPVADPVC
jgi:quercetin dioxygenase-like cupin family protein